MECSFTGLPSSSSCVVVVSPFSSSELVLRRVCRRLELPRWFHKGLAGRSFFLRELPRLGKKGAAVCALSRRESQPGDSQQQDLSADGPLHLYPDCQSPSSPPSSSSSSTIVVRPSVDLGISPNFRPPLLSFSLRRPNFQVKHTQVHGRPRRGSRWEIDRLLPAGCCC